MIIFDIEASGLHPESYPIEIAWQDSNDTNNFDSFFIRPADNWTYWDDYAETEIHHISQDRLLNEGISIEEACVRLNNSLAGQTIYSDAITFDQHWMMRLFEAAQIQPEFKFGSIFEFIPNDEAFSQLTEEVEIKHRALDDARQIVGWLKLLLNEN